MNKPAIRILIRLLDVLLEQLEDVAYVHKVDAPATAAALREALRSIRIAKRVITDHVEAYD